MPVRGRKPKPAELARLHGLPRDRAPTDGVKMASVEHLPEPPDFLSEEAKKEFRRLVESMTAIKMLTPHDLTALAVYCSAWGQFVEAEEMIASEGWVVDGGESGKTRNQWFYIRKDAITTLLKIGAEFGLTPSSRTRVAQAAGLLNGKKTRKAPIDGEAEQALEDHLDRHPGL